MKLSIIITVYNTDPELLKRCLDSFRDAEEVEVIIVDDGSTDKRVKNVISEYAEFAQYSVIDQKNKGVSAARNAGKRAASGEWITFCDADDVIDLPLLNKTVAAADQSDAGMVFSDYRKQANRKQTIELQECNDSHEYAELLLKQPNLYGTAWGKLYRRSSIENIFFDEDLSHSEDAVFLLRCMTKLKNVMHDSHHFYQYFVYERSSAKKKNDAVSQYVRAMETAEKVTEEAFPDLLPTVYDFCNTNLLIMLVNYIFNGKRPYREGKEILDQLRGTAVIQRSLSNIHLKDWENRFVLNAIRRKNDLLSCLAARVRKNVR